jgi:hypothetical protein
MEKLKFEQWYYTAGDNKLLDQSSQLPTAVMLSLLSIFLYILFWTVKLLSQASFIIFSLSSSPVVPNLSDYRH